MKLLSRTDQSRLALWWWTVDRTILGMIFGLMIFGVVLIAAAGPSVAETLKLSHHHFVMRQMIVLVPSLVVMIGVSMLDPRMIWRLASLVLVGAVVGIMITLVTGAEIKGAQRWIHLPFFSLQPAEFVKTAFVVVVAWVMARQKECPEFPAKRICAGLFVLLMGLLFLQPDVGTMVLLCVVFIMQIFLAGMPFRYVFLLCGGLAVLMGALYLTLPHVKSRVDRYLDPQTGDTFQISRSIESFQNGGLIGTGPAQGVVKSHLPDAHADFIFAVAAEELGFLLVSVLIALYALILLRGYSRSVRSGDLFVLLGAGGLLCLFGFQALIHMGSNVGLLPTKGMTLPFVSYGGSSLLACALSMGMVLGLTRKTAHRGIISPVHYRRPSLLWKFRMIMKTGRRADSEALT